MKTKSKRFSLLKFLESLRRISIAGPSIISIMSFTPASEKFLLALPTFEGSLSIVIRGFWSYFLSISEICNSSTASANHSVE
jgi:hypothetical protein